MHIFSQSPLGFSVAASVRVGNALGAGNPKQAVLSCKVSIICACKKRVILKRNNWKQTAGYMCYQHVCKQSLETQVMSSPSLFEISTCELFSHAVHFTFFVHHSGSCLFGWGFHHLYQKCHWLHFHHRAVSALTDTHSVLLCCRHVDV